MSDLKLNNILSKGGKSIINRWFDLILDTYPEADVLKKEKDRFANPVGHTILTGIEDIFDGILADYDLDKFLPLLDNIIRIRAIQEFAPSVAISFIFLLKQAIREEVKVRNNGIFEELLVLESKIDSLAAISFDIYMKCREKIHELKANEARMAFRLLEKAQG
ncbi:RsbRD N-terminal domain-containing protein [bacterium]|nr:RsbRD N-terminal domain-containing protein [bacterium]